MSKTPVGMVDLVAKALGNGNVVHHEPTPENPLGQSGVHTFADDIIDIVEKYVPPTKELSANLYRDLTRFILGIKKPILKLEDCFQDNTKWCRKHPGTKEFVCEFCGIYEASEPQCNKCTELGNYLPT